MRIMAIDPGTTHSGWVLIGENNVPQQMGREHNEHLLTGMRQLLRYSDSNARLHRLVLAVEYIEPRGMSVSGEVMATQFWAGRFAQLFMERGPARFDTLWTPILRTDVKLYLCGTPRAKDGNVRQAILDRYPASGGGRIGQLGTKQNPGPLYGVSRDIWSALAVALTCKAMLMGEYTPTVRGVRLQNDFLGTFNADDFSRHGREPEANPESPEGSPESCEKTTP
jgi:hypothetical protein